MFARSVDHFFGRFFNAGQTCIAPDYVLVERPAHDRFLDELTATLRRFYGDDPKTSVLNSHNQVWDAPNVFVTDGSCMTSAACQNPSLTYMALTARAAAFAVDELKRGNL